MGVATVRGYEGSDLSNPASVSASLKHYMGYSYPTTGGDRSPRSFRKIRCANTFFRRLPQL